jgi:hypothetical protein
MAILLDEESTLSWVLQLYCGKPRFFELVSLKLLMRLRFSNEQFVDEANHAQSQILRSQFVLQGALFNIYSVTVLRKSAIVGIRLADCAAAR